MKYEKTNRGFVRYSFKDFDGLDCRIQESSLATDDCIRFGNCENTMHLNKEQVLELIPLLYRFCETGYLHENN